MLNRRHLRIKVLQALYSYYSSGSENYTKGENDLMKSIDKIYDMYILYLTIFDGILEQGYQRIEEGKRKRLPSEEDLKPNLKFVNNKVLKLITKNKNILEESANRKISWAGQSELVRKLYTEIRESEEYKEYMAKPERSFEEDKSLMVKIFKKYIANFELIHHLIEEKSVFWVDDIDHVCSMMIKTLKLFKEDSDEYAPILPRWKEDDDEEDFVRTLFRRTVVNDEEIGKLVDEKTKNWDLERIAAMDIILMKMAITEAQEFPQIPVKVTLNEYIEISKYYSTPKSNGFINGILDKIFEELKSGGKIAKVGRGLVE